MTRCMEHSDEVVARARELYETHKSPTWVRMELRQEFGLWVSRDTLNDWLYFRTRYNDPVKEYGNG